MVRSQYRARSLSSQLKFVLVATAMMSVALFGGCNRADQSQSTAGSATGGRDAFTALRDVLHQYQVATHYHDRGTLRLSYATDGRTRTEETRIDIDFARPNQLRLMISLGINRLHMVSDGHHLWTRVDDPVTDNLRGQTVQRDVSAELTVGEIYAATEVIDPAIPSQMQSILLGLPLDLYASPLGLILSDSAFTKLFDGATTFQFGSAATLDSVNCDRIEAQATNGRYVFWIEQATQLIRRIEYPTRALFEAVPVGERPEQLSLTMDLWEPSFDRHAVASFEFDPEERAPLVNYLVLPPAPLPSDLLGKATEPIVLVDLSGEVQSKRDWDGKIQVLIWFDDHPASRVNLAALEPTYRRYGPQSKDVVFRAICTVPAERLDATGIRQLADQWKVSLPLLRDSRAAGRDVLGIVEAPTTIVLDPAGRLHLFEVGANPDLGQSVNIVVQRLLSGDNVAADVLNSWEARNDRFQQQLQLARVVPGQQTTAAAPAQAQATSFAKLDARIAWDLDTLKAPGNLELIGAESQELQLMALNDMREAVVIGSDGQIQERHVLDLPAAAFVSQLRHAIDGQGRKFYLAFSQSGRDVYVFDQQFRRILRYPPDDQHHNGIMDATLLDLDEDGQLEMYLGFAEPHGCQRVNLQGARVWSNRTLPTAVSLAGWATARSPYLLVTGESGTILPIRANGQHAEPWTVGQRTIHQLTASPLRSPEPTHLLGMSYTLEGRLIAVGLDETLREQWAYGLPGGVFRHQVRTPVWSPLLGGSWLLAGPNGSVHLVREDGSFFDSFNTGSAVLGLHGRSINGNERIYVVTPGKITAYDLSQRAEPR